VNAAARAAERLELAGENRRAAADPGYRLVSAGLKETARDHISSVRSNRLARVAQAKTEAAHARHDLKEAMPALDAVVADNRAGKADWQPGYKQTGILKLGSEPQAPDAQPAAGNGLTDSWIDRALAAATHWPVVGAMADRALERRAIQEMADQQYDEYLRRRPQERSYEGLSAFGPQAAVAAKQRDETASTGAQTMDPSTAKAEVAHAKHDLKEARREDIWQQAIEIGRQAQTAGEQRRQEKTETASPRMAP